MAKPASLEYVAPEFDLKLMDQVPFAQIGETALLPGVVINSVGSFNDLTLLEPQIVRALCMPHTPVMDHARFEYFGVESTVYAQLSVSLGALLRPKKFSGPIINGTVAVLPFEEQRVAHYSRAAARIPAKHTAVSLLISGSLGSRGEVSRPFEQEVSYVLTRGVNIQRFPAPTNSLRQAALDMSVTQRSAREVAGHVDVEVRGVYHPQRPRPAGDDGAPRGPRR